MKPAALGRETLYILGCGVADGVSHLGGRSFMLWACKWAASKPNANSNSHSGNGTLSRYHSQKYGPTPVILRIYAISKCTPTMWQG